jgi:Gpi18-like mannosyltransferase
MLFFVTKLIGIISVFEIKEEYQLSNYGTGIVVLFYFCSKKCLKHKWLFMVQAIEKSLINAKFSESAAWLKKVILQSLTSSVVMCCISERTKEEIKSAEG